MADLRDPSWIFHKDGDRHGRIIMTDGLALPSSVPRFFDALAEVRNATVGERDSGGSITKDCWRAINEALPLGPDQAACAGWSTIYINMPGELRACYETAPFDYTLEPGSDAEWVIWLTTPRRAEQCGSPDGFWLSPSLWFSPERSWVVLGGSTEPMSIVAASTTVIDELSRHPDLSVHVLSSISSR